MTSQPTVSAKRVNGHTEFTVEFKVRFTNTTFRTADAEVEVVFNAGGVGPDDYYETKDTLSFTVFQAQYRTFTEQAGCLRWQVAQSENHVSNAIRPRPAEGEVAAGDWQRGLRASRNL